MLSIMVNQGCNLKDKGFKVVIGLHKNPFWILVIEDGWKEDENSFRNY